MNMKKIMASVVAGALAISTLATGAFAASISRKTQTTRYNAEVTLNVTGTLTNGDNTFTLTAPAADKVESMSIEIKYADNKGDLKTYTKSVKEAKTATIKVADAVSVTADLSNVNLTAGFSATITALVSNTTAAYAAADANTSYTFAAPGGTGDATSGKVVVKDNTTDEGVNSPITLANIKKSDMRDLANGFSLDLAVWGTVATPTIVEVTVSGAADASKNGKYYGTLSANGTSVSIGIPAGVAAIFDDEEWDYANDASMAITPMGDTTSWTWGFYDANLVYTVDDETEETTTEETTAEETDADLSEDTDADISIDTDAAETTTAASAGDTDANDDDDKNAPTGVALAIVPAIVAGAAVIVSKKRK